jgi:3-oxoadipate CoA-transferase beta subunit
MLPENVSIAPAGVAEPLGWSPLQIAIRAYEDLAEGQYVNLGIGLPTMILAAAQRGSKEVIFHSENGILGLRDIHGEGERDPDLIDAGKNPVALVAGGSFFSHAESFAMIRGGHLDVAVLGAYEVTVAGHLANWSSEQARPSGIAPTSVPAVGGAVDLAANARSVFVLMKNVERGDGLRLTSESALPLTGRRCVTRVYANLGVFRPTGSAFLVEELADGVTRDYLVARFAANRVLVEFAN